ncbi:MAG: TatD family hydrolase, partial [Bacteriovoracia bacterium]
ITFPKAENVRKVLKIIPVSSLVIETDAPFLAPVPNRGKENTPEYLPVILEYIAKFKNIAIEELSEILYKNSGELFRI